MNYRKRFAVEPGSRVRLGEIDPAFTGKFEREGDAADALAAELGRLSDLQYKLYAEGTQALLIVLQGMDASGKDGTIRHVFRAFNPLGTSVFAFKVPTAAEAAHDFLWRSHAVVPAHGRIAIFNRSYYEDVLVTRVHDTISGRAAHKRLERIVEFEHLLAQSGTRVIKFFLHIGAAEQLKRFERRLDDPSRNWKISDSDYADRDRWDDFSAAYEDALERSSTGRAPWYVIPAEHKWFRNVAIARIVADELTELDPSVPATTVDLAAIRAKYHADAAAPEPRD